MQSLKVDDKTQAEFLQGALDMAQEAIDAGDDPFGTAIVTERGSLYERNRAVTGSDPSAHSEMLAIRTAAKKWGSDSLKGAIMLTSNQPCPMCFGAVLFSGLGQLILGADRRTSDPDLSGYTVEKYMDLVGTPEADRVSVVEGVYADPTNAFYAKIW